MKKKGFYNMFSYQEIIFFKSLQTPFYYYDLDRLDENILDLKYQAKKQNVKIHYALKANNNKPILKKIVKAGFGADCVSGPEVDRAIESGFNPEDIVFAGVGKTDDEIRFGIKNKISCFNCESIHELEIIDQIAGKMNSVASVALRINPDFNGFTNKKITTGTRYDKFGIPRDEIIKTINFLKRLKHVSFKGLHFHIGSQITNMDVFSELALEINQIQEIFIRHHLIPEVLNLGGGLGVDYDSPDLNQIPNYDGFFKAYLNNLNSLPGQEIHFELGRSIVAECGNLISKVLFLKNNDAANYAIIDAGMNDLMRPALYDAKHKIQNITGIGKDEIYHIAGPVCESSDVFGKNILVPVLKRGDLVAIRTSGAYGEVMASGYNLRKPAKAIYSTDRTIKTRKELALSS